MSNLKPLEIPELHKFCGYLEALKDFLIGGNYVVWFGARGLVLNSADFSTGELMQTAHQNSNPSKAKVVERSLSEMIQNINICLKLPDPPYAPNNLVNVIQNNLALEYLNHLRACIDIDYGESTILEYDEGEDLEYVDVYWRFAYIIINRQQQRCVIIHGGSSD